MFHYFWLLASLHLILFLQFIGDFSYLKPFFFQKAHFTVTSRVTKIVWGTKGVKVTVNHEKTFHADAAIVTVPLGVLKAKIIKFEPRLPDWKEEAIDGIGVGTENKIVLHFDKVFWPNVEFLGVVSSSAYGCSYFLNLHKATGNPVLVYMPAGRLAHDIEKMSDEDAAKFAFSQLKRILSDATEPVCFLSRSFITLNLLLLSSGLFFSASRYETSMFVFL